MTTAPTAPAATTGAVGVTKATGARPSLEYTVVVPTIGRPSLQRLLSTLAEQHFCPQHPGPQRVIVVDDRRPSGVTVPSVPLGATSLPVRVVRSGGRGPASARNAGWRSVSTPWVVFLDDDVELPDGWSRLLRKDLESAGESVAAVQSRLVVPLPADRPPTDWERNTAALMSARWITADMAYRRSALLHTSGFDERFRRAYREDSDLALRLQDAGWHLTVGQRTALHPVRSADPWISIRVQAGAGDDALMSRLHGRDWRHRVGAPPGRFRWHAMTVTLASITTVLSAASRPRTAAVAGLSWLLLTVDFLRRRVSPGPRPGDAGCWPEYRAMALTSTAIPFAAVWHRIRGIIAHRATPSWPPPIRAVLFDRDGTLVVDEPYNGEPALVRPVAGAAAHLRRLRDAGLRLGVVSNQSGIGRGLLSPAQVRSVNDRIEHELGVLGTWQVCPHRADAACWCRKPEPLLVLRAAAELGVAPYECVVVGDIGADVDAAISAGAWPVLVPTPATRQAEVEASPAVAASLSHAVDAILGGSGRPAGVGPPPAEHRIMPAAQRRRDRA